MIRVGPIVETALFVADVDRAADFYERVLGLDKREHDEGGAVFQVGIRQVLLLVDASTTREAKVTPGGVIPPCGASGSMHLAFGIEAADIDSLRTVLEEESLEVSRVAWERGGESLYFRDLDGHLIELLTDVEGLWGLDASLP